MNNWLEVCDRTFLNSEKNGDRAKPLTDSEIEATRDDRGMNMKRLLLTSLVVGATAFGSTVGIAVASQGRSLPNIAARIDAGTVAAAYVQFRHRGFRGRGYGGRGYYGRGYSGGRYRRGGGAGALIGGLAAGALIGGAIASQSAPGQVYGAPGGNATTYCLQRFKSFDPPSGTYLGLDGVRHPCP